MTWTPEELETYRDHYVRVNVPGGESAYYIEYLEPDNDYGYWAGWSIGMKYMGLSAEEACAHLDAMQAIHDPTPPTTWPPDAETDDDASDDKDEFTSPNDRLEDLLERILVWFEDYTAIAGDALDNEVMEIMDGLRESIDGLS